MFLGINFRSNEKGASGVLPLMFSTIGGAAFLFTFYNLTQYTAARSAADQAARRVSRCLTATDAECKVNAVNGFTNGGGTQQWYGYLPQTGPTTIQVDTYKYNAEVYATNYGANFNSYEILDGNAVLQHQEASIKPARFFGLLNSYQILKADLMINVRNNRTGGSKTCNLKEAVEFPAGFNIDVTNPDPAFFYDDRWCNGHTSFDEMARLDPNCSDVNNGSWELFRNANQNNTYCHLDVPPIANGYISSFQQLGGTPVCDGDKEAPYSEIPQGNQIYSEILKYFGSATQPGDTGRAHAVTGARQFVVVEVFSCNPTAFLEKLSNTIKTKDDLIKYFKSYPVSGLPQHQGNPDFNSSAGNSAFVYSGAPGVSVLNIYDWTYFEWTRQANGTRHLERKVCNWVSYDDAIKLYSEFRTGQASTYVQGAEFASSIPTLKFYDVPSCLNPDKQTLDYICPNRTIAGQPGSFMDCNAWQSKKNSLENEYKANVEKAISLNSNQSWLEFEDLSKNFSWEITPKYSQSYTSPAWNFSWSNNNLNGVAVINPGAVRDYQGLNPKTLPTSSNVKAYQMIDDSLDPMLNEKLRNAIAQNQGHAVDNNLAYSAQALGGPEPISISGVWPFLKDEQGNPVTTVRPYVNENVNGRGFDYNLDCRPDDICGTSPTYSSMEQVLRTYASNVFTDVNLNNTAYKFSYQETLVGPQFLDPSVQQSYPDCTQYRTLCQRGAGGGPRIDLGQSLTMPVSCRDGTYLNCYPEYVSTNVSTVNYQENVLLDIARNKALGEVRRIIPTANLCSDLSQPNCVVVDIQKVGKEMQVGVQFVAQLTTPFTEILNQNTLTVSSNKREIVETERLK